MKHTRRVLIFTGDGKGKTTAALGMALRAAGHGLPVLVAQFVKSDASTGEVRALHALPGAEWFQCGRGFIPRRDGPRRDEHVAAAEEALERVAEALHSGRYRVVVLDEVCVAVAAGLLSEQSVARAIEGAAPNIVIALTGRGATPGLIEMADTVTEMRCLKHGYQSGIAAQMGVEY